MALIRKQVNMMKSCESLPSKPHIVEPLQFELDLFPSHILYVLLCESNTFPIIIADDILPRYMRALKSTVKKYIRATGGP